MAEGAVTVAPPRAPVTFSLIVLNVVVFGAMVLSGVSPISPDGGALVTWGANYGPAFRSGEWWRLITAAFVHFGVLHLTLNMWALRAAGPLVERLYGSATFAAIYLVSAITGSLASLLRGQDTLSAGASGAIFGVFGALVAFLFTHRGVIEPRALQSLRSSALTVIAFNLGAGFLIPIIDNRAHIGGLLGGALAGLAAGSFRARPGARSSLHPALRVLVAGAAMAGALAMVVPRSDGGGELQQAGAWLDQEQSRLDGLDADIARRLQDGAPAQDLARLYEDQVVPGWEAVVTRLEELSPAARAHDPELIELVTLKRDMVRAKLAAMRTNQPEAIDRYHALSSELEKRVQARQRKTEGNQPAAGVSP